MLCLFFFPSDKVYAGMNGGFSGSTDNSSSSSNSTILFASQGGIYDEYNFHPELGADEAKQRQKLYGRTVVPYMMETEDGNFVRSVDVEKGAEDTE